MFVTRIRAPCAKLTIFSAADCRIIGNQGQETYDSCTATRPWTTHPVVRVVQSIRRTEENTRVASCAWRTDRISHSGEFVQSKTGAEESPGYLLRRKQRRSRDFWNGPNRYRPERSGTGLLGLLEDPPIAYGDCRRTSALDRDAVEQASCRSSPAGRTESPGGIDRSCDLNSENCTSCVPQRTHDQRSSVTTIFRRPPILRERARDRKSACAFTDRRSRNVWSMALAPAGNSCQSRSISPG